MSHFDIITDLSKEKLVEVPKNVLEMTNLKMLFLEGNFLYSIPDDFFQRLPKLMWLDLRNNMLEEVPRSIAHHQCLENLLLTNNNIKRLPNELGLVPNLKALQISENPLVYPSKKIVSEGTKVIKTYLREQHEKALQELQRADVEDETILKITEMSSVASRDETSLKQKSSKSIRSKSSKRREKGSSEETIKSKSSSVQQLEPSLQVKKLSDPNKIHKEPIKIVHNISKSGSKISLKSYFHEPASTNMDRVPDAKLKEGWLNKLRILLSDQERILQQERNLRALADWRMQKRAEAPKTFYDNEYKVEPPFATYPEHSKMPTRDELTAELENFLRKSDDFLAKRSTAPPAYINIEKLITDLVQQLREMESTCGEMRTPRSEIESAGQEIQKIIDIHKKLLRLKAANDSSL